MSDESSPAAPPPSECRACRGTGKVVSNLGGSPSQVTCPWCEGSGSFIAEHDAIAAGKTLRGDG